MKNKILFCCLLIFLAACSKDDGMHTWEGKVLEYGTMKPVPNAILFLQLLGGEILGPPTYETIDSTVTDQNGRFSFSYLKQPGAYQIKGYAENYFPNEVSRVQNSKHISKDLILEPYAWLKVDIDCQHPDLYQIVVNNFECTPRSFINGEKSVSTICTFRGNRTNKFSLLIGILNNQSVRDTIELFLPALDTTHLELNY